jgi:hypothetical protein
MSMIIVSVSFPVSGDWNHHQYKVEAIVKKQGGQCGNIGSELGMVNMELSFQTERKAATAKEKIQGLKIEGLEIG